MHSICNIIGMDGVGGLVNSIKVVSKLLPIPSTLLDGPEGEIVWDTDGRLWFVNYNLDLYRLTTYDNREVVIPHSHPCGDYVSLPLRSRERNQLVYLQNKNSRKGGWSGKRAVGVKPNDVPEWYTLLTLEVM